MSELKVASLFEFEKVLQGRSNKLFYSKSEVDKVIADLEESHKMEVGQLLMEIVELKAQKAQAEDDCAYWKTMSRKRADDNEVMAKQRAEAFKRERHQKYKRCLAMAKWCASLKFAWSFIPEDDEVHKSNFYDKWNKRWLELAEKFKEAE